MTPGSYTINGITFSNLATTPYIINSNTALTNGFTLNTGITNNSTVTQTINDLIALSRHRHHYVNEWRRKCCAGRQYQRHWQHDHCRNGHAYAFGANTFSGGITLSTGDVLNVNSATALGATASTLTIAGTSTINNTSGAAITETNNNAVNLNADLTFTGTQNLNLGSGVVTLGGGALGSARTITVSAGTLTMGPFAAGSNNNGLTVAGPGVLSIFNAGTNTVTGDLTVNGSSTFNMTVATTVGGLLGSGTVAIGPNASATRTLTVNTAGNETFTGTLTNTFIGTTNLAMNFAMNGTGSETLSGTLNFTGSVVVNQGTLNLSSPLGTNPTFGPAGNIVVANTANTNGILNISQNLTIGTGSSVNIGGNGAATAIGNVNGAIYQTGGNFVERNFNGQGSFQLSASNGGYGYYKLSNGTLTNTEVGIGGGLGGTGTGTVGVMDITGGTFNEGGWVTVARGGAGSTGILNMTGGTLNMSHQFGGRLSIGNGFPSGNPMTGVINLSNGAQILAQSPGSGYLFTITDRDSNGMTGIANLGVGGLMRIGPITAAGADANTADQIAQVNFHGGTLQASGSENLLTGEALSANNRSGVFVYSQGGVIDNNGFIVAVSNPLLAPTDFGLTTTIPVSNGGSGYVGAPAVLITGGTGFGATAVANMISDGAGALKVGSITVTNPGYGYGDSTGGGFVAPTITLLGGTQPANIAVAGAVSTALNASGGMNFAGTGITTLSSTGTFATGTSTYTGATTVPAGTLRVIGTASINSTSGITVGTVSTRAKLVVTSSTVMTPSVLITNGALDGTGSISGTITVADRSTNTVANGNSGALALFPPLQLRLTQI